MTTQLYHTAEAITLCGLLTFLLLSVPSVGATEPTGMTATPDSPEAPICVRQEERAEQMRKACVDFVSKECHLTPKEKQRLEEEYARMDARKMQLWRERSRLLRKIDKGGIPEKEYGEALDRILEIDGELQECRRDLFRRLGSDLSSQKQAKVYIAMLKFNRDFFHKSGPKGSHPAPKRP